MQRIASLVMLGALVNNGLGASCSATDGGCSGATRDDGGCGASCDAGCCESLANADCFGCGWRVHANSLVWTRDIQNSAELVQPRIAGEAFNLADARSIDDFGFDYESGMEVGIARFFFANAGIRLRWRLHSGTSTRGNRSLGALLAVSLISNSVPEFVPMRRCQLAGWLRDSCPGTRSKTRIRRTSMTSRWT